MAKDDTDKLLDELLKGKKPEEILGAQRGSSPSGTSPPAEYEEAYYSSRETSALPAAVT